MPPIDELPGTDIEVPEDDLRASLTTQVADAFEAAKEPVAEPDPKAAQADKPEETPAQARARNERGQFAAKEPETKAAPEAAAPKELPSKDEPAPASVTASPPSAPPAGWTAAEKAEWSKLSPVAQAAVSRRENEITQGGKQWSEQKRRYEEILAPLTREANQAGLPVGQALDALLTAHRGLKSDPAGVLLNLARQYGVDLSTIAGRAPAEGSPQANHQPDINALVRQAIQPMLAPLQERFQAEDRHREDMTLKSINDFAVSPGHEHYAAVERGIALILPQVIEENPAWTNEQKLQEAYDRAIYANPVTRQLVLSAQSAAADEQRRKDTAERAGKARLAGSSVTGSPRGSPAPKVHDTLRGELEAAFAAGS